MADLFIPIEFFKRKEINAAERMVLAVYLEYTQKDKCCTLTNQQIADELYMSIDYVKKIKRHLKDLGYIRTDGRKVIYQDISGKLLSDKTRTFINIV